MNMSRFVQLQEDKSVRPLIYTLGLNLIRIEDFLKYFNLPNDPKNIIAFIQNPDNFFELARFGHHQLDLIFGTYYIPPCGHKIKIQSWNN